MQVGSGLSGQPTNSYALYNASLVDDCLQLPSAGCNRTIAFWSLTPNRLNSWAFSTIRKSGTENPEDIIGNSGVVISAAGTLLLITVWGQNSWHLIIIIIIFYFCAYT